ncbi:hypothetical protein F4859DRAFT_215093 [Xylaria cf. heliscus]|nr:hypothetical protein F4859DRAFT_215093 [Xylaria cf. heliscus]
MDVSFSHCYVPRHLLLCALFISLCLVRLRASQGPPLPLIVNAHDSMSLLQSSSTPSFCSQSYQNIQCRQTHPSHGREKAKSGGFHREVVSIPSPGMDEQNQNADNARLLCSALFCVKQNEKKKDLSLPIPPSIAMPGYLSSLSKRPSSCFFLQQFKSRTADLMILRV